MPLASAQSRCPVSATAEDGENGKAPGRLPGALRLFAEHGQREF